MHDHAPLIEARVARTLTERIRPAEVTRVCGLDVTAWHVNGEPVSRTVGFSGPYRRFRVGDSWGPAWGTTWFRMRTVVPEHLRDAHLELLIDLGWADHSPGFQCEGLVLDTSGRVIKAINPRNRWVPVTLAADDGVVEVVIEAAANPILLDSPPFQPTALGSRPPHPNAPIYRLAQADLVVVHDEVRELVADIVTLDGLQRALPDASTRRWQILRALDDSLDLVRLSDVPGTAAGARERLAQVLDVPAGPDAHEIIAVGHAHIDSAWLWPVRETRRKVGRTLANALRLIEDGKNLTFVLPAAQHAAWLEEDDPALFARVVDQVKAGRIVPVGGMWVEPDANLPGGESMCRQFLYGQQFYESRFGTGCDGVWLPDSFGYSAALPQIARLAGAEWFLTQKISWNQVNKFPHHTFWWEGIDGTRILTHFPSVDTYNSDLSAAELAHAESNFRDKGRTNISLVPFGYGDGGGGPTREMLAQAARVADLAGSPRVRLGTPAEFSAAAAEYDDASVWVGELVLELHRATFTSQAETKRGNRRSEHLLREAELWCATAAAHGTLDYPFDELENTWKQVLLGQFHDILPGTSIAWVHRDIEQVHAAVQSTCLHLIERAIQSLGRATADGGLSGQNQQHAQDTQHGQLGHGPEPTVYANAAPVQIDGIPPLSVGARVSAGGSHGRVSVTEEASGTIVDNGLLRVRVDTDGLIDSLRDLGAAPGGRELIPAGRKGGLLAIHEDFPNKWDAWDVDAHYRGSRRGLTAADSVQVDQSASQDSVTVTTTRTFGASTAVQRLRLDAADPRLHVEVEVDWHEDEQFLKLEFPLDVHAQEARFETQFGHVARATHTNTSWDAARFEVHAHRWVHVGEPGYGVALANEATYGYDVTREASEGGGTCSIVRASLLRAPRYPDPDTDRGHHVRRFTLRPGALVADAVADGYALNVPLRAVDSAPRPPLVSVEGPAIVEAVKFAEDRSGDLIVRLYEPLGSRNTSRVRVGVTYRGITCVDVLERPFAADTDPALPARLGAVDEGEGPAVDLALRPFQIATLRVAR